MTCVKVVLAACSLLLLAGQTVPVGAEANPLTQQEKEFYSSAIVPALMVIKIAMPQAPEGWTVGPETAIDSASPGLAPGDIENFHFTYAVTYRRNTGSAEETAKLEAAAAEITKRNTAAADALTGKLKKERSETERAVVRAKQRGETGRERKLKKRLEEIRKQLAAVPGDRDRKISEETEPLVIRDRQIEIRVSVNESVAEYPGYSPFSRPKAAFALRTMGGREGALGWKEGSTVILYGDWQEVKNNSFRLRAEQRPFASHAQSIRIEVIGDRTRTEQFLRKMDIRSILDLMK